MAEAILILILLFIIAAVLIILGIGAWLFFRAVIVTSLAEKNVLFTFRKEGHIKYLMEGERLIRYIYKIQGYYIDSEGYVLKKGFILNHETGEPKASEGAGNEPEVTLSERIFGAQWIGFPPRRMLQYSIMYARPERPGDKSLANENPKDYQVDGDHDIVLRNTTTWYHAWRQIYSIYIPKIEVKGFTIDEGGQQTQGQAQVDLWGTFTLKTFNARIPVLELRGQWFPHIRDAISGAVADYFSGRNLDEVRRLPKASNVDASGRTIPTDFESKVLQASFGPSGTMHTTGLVIIAFNTAGIEVEDKAEEALRKRAIARVDADARKVKGQGEGNYQRELGQGIADAYSAKAVAITKNPAVIPVLVSENRAKGMKDLKGVFVEGGASSNVSILATPEPAADKDASEGQNLPDQTTKPSKPGT